MKCPKPVVKVCDSFSACTIAGTLLWDAENSCLSITKRNAPDGWVTAFRIQNDCVVELSYEQLDPRYVAPPCAPLPADCSGNTGGGGGGSGLSYTISADPNNLTRLVNGEVMTRLYATGSGVIVTGAGTLTDPLSIVYTPQVVSVAINALRPIVVTGTGSTQNPYIFSLSTEGVTGGIANGLSFDIYGRFTGFSQTSVPLPISAGNGISLRQVEGLTIIDQTMNMGTPGTYRLGAFNVTVDHTSRFAFLNRVVELTPVDVVVGEQTLSFDEFGNLVSVTGTAATQPPAGTPSGTSFSIKTTYTVEEFTWNVTSGTKLRIRIEGMEMRENPLLNPPLSIDGVAVGFEWYRNTAGVINQLVAIAPITPGTRTFKFDATGADMHGQPFIFMDVTA